jgi:hypothetical protein
MKHSHDPLNIYQLRIVLRGISPLIWRRVLVHDTATLAQLHDIIQILFAWQHEHLYDFHIYRKDYGTGGADTRSVTLSQFQFHKGERFRYVYDYYAYWVCDIRLEATLPVDPKCIYPVCTGGKNASPSENFLDVQAYLQSVTLEDLLGQLKAQGITQKAFAEQIGMNPRHLTAIKSSELRHHYYNELGATKLACLWMLEHLGKTKRR